MYVPPRTTTSIADTLLAATSSLQHLPPEPTPGHTHMQRALPPGTSKTHNTTSPGRTISHQSHFSARCTENGRASWTGSHASTASISKEIRRVLNPPWPHPFAIAECQPNTATLCARLVLDEVLAVDVGERDGLSSRLSDWTRARHPAPPSTLPSTTRAPSSHIMTLWPAIPCHTGAISSRACR